MQLRPSGTKGPVAVSFAAFEGYYGQRGRDLGIPGADPRAGGLGDVGRLRGQGGGRHRGGAARARATSAARPPMCRDMRQLMADERPAKGFWDLKLSAGGLVDIEFAAQFLQLVHGRRGRTAAAEHRRGAGRARARRRWRRPNAVADLVAAWRLQQDLIQLLKVALAEDADPDAEPKALRALLAKAGGRARLSGPAHAPRRAPARRPRRVPEPAAAPRRSDADGQGAAPTLKSQHRSRAGRRRRPAAHRRMGAVLERGAH